MWIWFFLIFIILPVLFFLSTRTGEAIKSTINLKLYCDEYFKMREKNMDDFLLELKKDNEKDRKSYNDKILILKKNIEEKIELLSKEIKNNKIEIKQISDNIEKSHNSIKTIKESFFELKEQLLFNQLNFSKKNNLKIENFYEEMKKNDKKIKDTIFSLKDNIKFVSEMIDSLKIKFINYDKKVTKIRMDMIDNVLSIIKKVKKNG